MGRKLIEAVLEKTDVEKLAAMTVEALKMGLRLDNGRHYLMSTKPDNISVEDCLEAFGFTRDGLRDSDKP